MCPPADRSACARAAARPQPPALRAGTPAADTQQPPWQQAELRQPPRGSVLYSPSECSDWHEGTPSDASSAVPTSPTGGAASEVGWAAVADGAS
eukprot:gene18510-16801_t